MMEVAPTLLRDLALPIDDCHNLPSSAARFPDSAEYRIEILGVEGQSALRTVIEAAEVVGVSLHRVSQGSGIMLLSDRRSSDPPVKRLLLPSKDSSTSPAGPREMTQYFPGLLPLHSRCGHRDRRT